LAAFPIIEPRREVYESAAALLNRRRSSGIQVATVDCLIASNAIENDCHLFTLDKDFQAIATMSPLKLFRG
jgi:predicted nucleic acid-binding protein